MLDDVLSPREKEDLPALGSRGGFAFKFLFYSRTSARKKGPLLSGFSGDNNGSKRLIKLNGLLKKSPPLKPWTMRASVDSTVRSSFSLLIMRHVI